MRAGAVQLNSTEDTDRNLETADRLVRDAWRRGAELVVLPEKWSVLGTGEQIAAGAETLDGRCIAWARAPRASSASTSWPARSSSACRARRSSPTRASTSGPTASSGRSTARSTCSTSRSTASATASPTTSRPATRSSSPTWPRASRSGLSICYDVRFPELYRMLSARGAQVLTVPSAFTLATTRDHWEVLLRARAIENQCFVIAPNQIGDHPAGLRSGGRSMIVDPWGHRARERPRHRDGDRGRARLRRAARGPRAAAGAEHRRPEVYA